VNCAWPESVRSVVRREVERRLRRLPEASREDVEDLEQETLCRLAQVAPPIEAEPYAAKAAHHVVNSFLRKERRRWANECPDGGGEATCDPWKEVEAQWIEPLPEPARTVVLLGLLGFDDDDVSVLLEMTPANVRQIRSRARKRLRAAG